MIISGGGSGAFAGVDSPAVSAGCEPVDIRGLRLKRPIHRDYTHEKWRFSLWSPWFQEAIGLR